MDSHLNPACVGCGFAIPFRKEFVFLDSKPEHKQPRSRVGMCVAVLGAWRALALAREEQSKLENPELSPVNFDAFNRLFRQDNWVCSIFNFSVRCTTYFKSTFIILLIISSRKQTPFVQERSLRLLACG